MAHTACRQVRDTASSTYGRQEHRCHHQQRQRDTEGAIGFCIELRVREVIQEPNAVGEDATDIAEEITKGYDLGTLVKVVRQFCAERYMGHVVEGHHCPRRYRKHG